MVVCGNTRGTRRIHAFNIYSTIFSFAGCDAPGPPPPPRCRSPVAGGRWPASGVALAGLFLCCGVWGVGAGRASQLSPSPSRRLALPRPTVRPVWTLSPDTSSISRGESEPLRAHSVHCAHTTGYVASFQPSSPSATTLSGSGSLSPVRGAGNVRLIRGAAEHVHVEANGRECEKRCASRQNRPHARQPWSARVWGEKARGPGERGGFGT